jgi:hypothetical protein
MLCEPMCASFLLLEAKPCTEFPEALIFYQEKMRSHVSPATFLYLIRLFLLKRKKIN